MGKKSRQGRLVSTAIFCLASGIEGASLADDGQRLLAQNQSAASARTTASAAKAPAGAGNAQPADSQAGAHSHLLLAISEGASGGLDASELLRKYAGLKSVMEQALGREVRIVSARNFELLERGLESQQYDFAMARPSDYMARAIRDSHYSLVVTANPDGMCTIIVRKDSPIKTLADLRGKRIGLPEAVAYMSRFCAADLRDNGIDIAKETKVQYLREQDVIGYAVENGMIDAGGISSFSGVAHNWEKKGNRILHQSVKLPYFPLIASPAVSRADVEKVRKALLALSDSESGKEILQSLSVQGFISGDQDRLIKMLSWLGKE